MSIINQTLQTYLDAIDSGFGLIGGDVRWLFNTLVVLNVVIAGLFWAFSEDQVIVPLVRKIIYVGIFAWLVENWVSLTDTLAATFMQLGIKAGGGSFSQDVILNPAAIADRGFDTVMPMLEAMGDLAGPIGFFENFPEILLLMIAVLTVLLAFSTIAIQVVMAILIFKLGTLVVFILLPFSLIKHTAFMAERPLGWVVSAGVRLMLLTLVVGLGERMFGQLQILPDKLTVRASLDIALGALVLLVLAQTASRLAGELATGTPRLGAMDAGFALLGTGVATRYAARQTYAGMRMAGTGARFAATKSASAVRYAAKKMSKPQD